MSSPAARGGGARPAWGSTVGWATSGGLLGGVAVGLTETAWVVASTAPSEYQALVYAAVLYGLVGAGLGVGVGLALLLLRPLGVPGAGRTWCLSFFVILTGLGSFIGERVLDRARYAEQGVPDAVMAWLILGLLLLSLFGVWIGTNLLTKTPLKVLPGRKGTLAAWGGIVGLSFLFSRAPPPGARRVMAPHHPQTALLQAKPDVYVLLVDTLRADALGVYGAQDAASPRIDAFAAEAVVFDQAISAASWTRASVASIVTASLPSQHGCRGKDAMLPPSVETLAEVLQHNGFATGGLPDNPNISGTFGFDQGFDWYPYAPRYPLWARESTYGLSLYGALRLAWARVTPERRVEDYYLPAETQVDRALDWIQAQRGDRHFLFVHLMEPHDPYFSHPYDGEAVGRADTPDPPPGQAAHLRALYADEVRHLDTELGRFFDRLAADGRYDDALIVLAADHGEEFQEHGGWWHGVTAYDEMVHVPLIIKLPGNRAGGTRVPWQVRTIDIAPTVTDLVGVDIGADWVGESVFVDDFDAQLARMRPPVPPVLEGTAPEGAEAPEEGIWEVPEEGDAEDLEEPVEDGPFVPPTWADHPASRTAVVEQELDGYLLQALRVEGKKCIEVLRAPTPDPRSLPATACFDLLVDPGEQHDLSGPGSPCAPELADRLHDFTGRGPESDEAP